MPGMGDSTMRHMLRGAGSRASPALGPDTGAMATMAGAGTTGPYRLPPMPAGMRMPMLRGMEKVPPKVTPFLPGEGIDPATLPAATPRTVVTLADGDTFDLKATLVRRTIGGRAYVMYGYN